MDRWSRRQFVQGVGAAGVALLAGCGRLPGQASPPAKVLRVGFLTSSAQSGPDRPNGTAFRQGLRDLGYIEGQDLIIEWRLAGETADEAPALAAELVQFPVDVIVAPSSRDALVAKSATSTIPIVVVNSADPVGVGLVASLAHPGGNVTGLSIVNTVLGPKRMELLKEAVPQAARVACLYDPAEPAALLDLAGLSDAARVLGVTLEPVSVATAGELEPAFEAVGRLPADALLIAVGAFLPIHAPRIVDFAARSRLPAVYHNRLFVDAGGLMTYAARLTAQYRRAATYVDKILKGARPSDLPVEQAREFELVINLKTAQALGLTIPQHVLLQATEVIE